VIWRKQIHRRKRRLNAKKKTELGGNDQFALT
jgi:hypothetical protein